MPTFRSGEMFRAGGFIIVTGNSFLTSEMKLVMGRGAALQLKRKEPGIDLVFGEKIHKTCGHLGFYGLIFHGRYGLARILTPVGDISGSGKSPKGGEFISPGLLHGSLQKCEGISQTPSQSFYPFLEYVLLL